MRQDSSIKNFLVSKKLLDQDKKTLSRNASSKSLSRSTSNLRINQANQPQPRQKYGQLDQDQDVPRYHRQSQPVKKDLWAAMKNLDGNFSSSRQQTKSALSAISRRIHSQLRMFTSALDDYRQQLNTTFQKQYDKIRQQLHLLIEKTFDRWQQDMRRTFLEEQQRLNHEAYASHRQLEDLSSRIESMIQQLDGPDWKKVAGMVLSNDIMVKSEAQLEKLADKMRLDIVTLTIPQSRKNNFMNSLNEVTKMKVDRVTDLLND